MTSDYADLLKRPEWYRRRKEIFARDGFLCQKCSSSGYDRQLQVHHLRYRVGVAPWEYEDEELLTLCIDCHKLTHATSKIPVFDESGDLVSIPQTMRCERCDGPGYIPQYPPAIRHGIPPGRLDSKGGELRSRAGGGHGFP